MNGNDFKQLATIRLRDSEVLLKNGNSEGAYYLAGYVVECGLKACIAKKTMKYDFPDRKTASESHTHDLVKPVKSAGLERELQEEMERDLDFEVNWTSVKDWSEASRYDMIHRRQAEDLYAAIADRQHGVLRWIKRYW